MKLALFRLSANYEPMNTPKLSKSARPNSSRKSSSSAFARITRSRKLRRSSRIWKRFAAGSIASENATGSRPTAATRSKAGLRTVRVCWRVSRKRSIDAGALTSQPRALSRTRRRSPFRRHVRLLPCVQCGRARGAPAPTLSHCVDSAANRMPEGVIISSQGPATRDAQFDAAWIAKHLETERREASVLSEIREAVFGAQDGLTSVLAVVSTVGGATGQPFAVLVAGLAATLAGVFSMAAGEYMSSKSQREIFEAQIASEAAEVEQRPAEAEAEVAFMLQEEGLEPAAAFRLARELASSNRVLLKTMVEKELGLVVED